MSDVAPPETEFRWQALFQRAREAVFLLNRQRRFLFVNRAWQELTGLSPIEVRGTSCPRRATGEEPRDVQVRAACCPPPEVLQGRAGSTRRRAPAPAGGSQWWDIEFLPLHDDNGLLGVLGRIVPLPTSVDSGAMPAHETLAALHEIASANLSADQAERLWQPEHLLALRQRLLERHRLDHLPDSTPALRRVAEQVRLASRSRIPVLLAGEPGTGKHWLARTIHAAGPDRERPFVALDCARLPASALADVLFAERERGRPICGTLYLRAPAHLPRELQQRLLQRLVGSEDGAQPRLLAGCGADPAEAVRSGQWLEEFYCALSPLFVQLPPLRERLADLPALTAQFLERANDEGGRRVLGLTAAVWNIVRTHRWPGNLRELYHVLSVGRRHASGAQIDVADLPAALRLAVGLEEVAGAVSDHALPLDHLLEEAERRLIQLALRRARGNKTRAAELLAVWRPRLLRRMEILGIQDDG